MSGMSQFVDQVIQWCAFLFEKASDGHRSVISFGTSERCRVESPFSFLSSEATTAMTFCSCLVRASTSSLRNASSTAARSLHSSSLARQAETVVAAQELAEQSSTATTAADEQAIQATQQLQESASGLVPPLDENVQMEIEELSQSSSTGETAPEMNDDTFSVLERRRRLLLSKTAPLP